MRVPVSVQGGRTFSTMNVNLRVCAHVHGNSFSDFVNATLIALAELVPGQSP